MYGLAKSISNSLPIMLLSIFSSSDILKHTGINWTRSRSRKFLSDLLSWFWLILNSWCDVVRKSAKCFFKPKMLYQSISLFVKFCWRGRQISEIDSEYTLLIEVAAPSHILILNRTLILLWSYSMVNMPYCTIG